MLFRSLTRPSLALVAPLALVWLAASEASAQKSYPLICKAGGAMVAEVRAGAQVRVRFDAGTSAGSETPPSRGQCSWLDRGFRSGEPTVLAVDGNGSQASYLVDSVMRGETFYAHVYNQNGAMVVTRVGP